MSSADEGYNNLRVPPGVWAMKVPSTIDPPSSSFPVAGSFPEGLDLRVYASGWPFVTFGAAESGTLRTEGLGVCACASGQPSITFGLQKVISFGPKVMVFELALLSVHPIPSGTLGSISLWPCEQVREHFRG